MKRVCLATSPFETQKIGETIAKEILKLKPKKKAIVLGLIGDFGGGKTCFLQGFAQGLGIKQRVLSPTFIIMRRFNNFYHIDCYRIQKPQELLDLGFKRIIANPKNIVAVEWADRIRKIMPLNTIWIEFELIGERKRKIMIR